MAAVVVFAAFAGALSMAMAADALPPPEPPGVFNHIVKRTTPVYKPSCGDAKATPFCAVDQLAACFVHAKDEICKRVLIDPDSRYTGSSLYLEDGLEEVGYRLIWAGFLTQEQIDRWLDRTIKLRVYYEPEPRALSPWRAGDLLLELQWFDCPGYLPDCYRKGGTKPDPRVVVVRRTAEGWRVVDFYNRSSKSRWDFGSR